MMSSSETEGFERDANARDGVASRSKLRMSCGPR